jgi:6-phosphofructokinase 1
MKNIAILCSGGDVSGMNPALKRFVEYSYEKNLSPYFVDNGFEGLIDDTIYQASYADVTGIITRGGTKIGSSRSLRFKEAKYRAQAKQNLDNKGIDKLIVLGGDGSSRGMDLFAKEHDIAFCVIPSTIDNDIHGTEYCLGVDTALNIIKTAIDSIRDTASSFRRAFIIETMGRDCGYLALISALTSGAELCLIPEKDHDINDFKDKFQKQIDDGRKYFIAVVSEGIKQSSQSIAQWFEDEFNMEARVTILGHMQRGGNPSIRDRFMAYQFTTYAIDGLLNGETASVICYNHSTFTYKSIQEVTGTKHQLENRLLELGSSILG